MKRFVIGLAVVGLAAGVAVALWISWPATERPPLALPDADHHALIALGAATNHYYCIRAECSGPFEGGVWVITFADRKGSLKTAYVRFDKTTTVKDGLQQY